MLVIEMLGVCRVSGVSYTAGIGVGTDVEVRSNSDTLLGRSP